MEKEDICEICNNLAKLTYWQGWDDSEYWACDDCIYCLELEQ